MASGNEAVSAANQALNSANQAISEASDASGQETEGAEGNPEAGTESQNESQSSGGEAAMAANSDVEAAGESSGAQGGDESMSSAEQAAAAGSAGDGDMQAANDAMAQAAAALARAAAAMQAAEEAQANTNDGMGDQNAGDAAADGTPTTAGGDTEMSAAARAMAEASTAFYEASIAIEEAMDDASGEGADEGSQAQITGSNSTTGMHSGTEQGEDQMMASADGAQGAGEDSGTRSAAASTETDNDDQPASRGGQTGSQSAANGEQQVVAGASQTQQTQDIQAAGGRPSQGSTMTAEQHAAMQQAANEMRAASERMARASGQLFVLAYPGDANIVVVQGAPGGLPDLPSGQDAAQKGDDAGGDGSVGMILVLPGGESDDERLATLDGELNASLQVFDGVLLSGRQPTLGGGAGSASGAGESGVVYGETGSGKEGGEVGSGIQVASLPSGNIHGSSTVDGNIQNGTAAGRESAGGPQPVNSGARASPAAAQVIDGTDDDIVARQLREAALNETDPILQDKLWQEYIAYKKATGQ